MATKKNIKYGVEFDPRAGLFDVEQWCLANHWPSERGGLGTYGHLKNLSKLLWPDMVWHEWAETQLKSLCDDQASDIVGDRIIRNVSWAGCATSGKTFQAGHFAMLFFLADPSNTICIMCSTTAKMVRKRVWPVIQQLYHGHKYEENGVILPLGYMIDSRSSLRPKQKDDKHGIHCIAVAEGETQKAVADIQGWHAPRILIVIDEATDTPEAIYATIPNLRKGCQELIVLTLGNSLSHLDPHGRVSEPKVGWSKITRFSKSWETKAIKEWQLPKGMCYHFPGRESPNVKAKRTLYPFLYTWEDHQNALQQKGEENLGYWKYDEGFWPPDGVVRTIFSETMVEMYDGRGKLIFLNQALPIASLDPGFGGDNCVLKFGLMGDVTARAIVGASNIPRFGVQITETIHINPIPNSEETFDLQIARRVMMECKKRGIPPNRFGLDTTGPGRSVHSHLCEIWSHDVIAVNFGGSASDMPSSMADPRPSNQVYDRRVTELWFMAAEFLKSSQLKGLTKDEIIQFCTREYDLIGGGKMKIKPKEDVREKLGHSPDDADAVVILLEVARKNGAVPERGSSDRGSDDWLAMARRFDTVYSNGPESSATENFLDSISNAA